ncbi:MAG: hypothetical protein LM590_01945 [Thermofilum sp.]|nr:hypothetical protein [Thermofilum sp.]
MTRNFFTHRTGSSVIIASFSLRGGCIYVFRPRDFIPIIVSRFNVHVTIFSLVEFAASIYYTRKTPLSTSIFQVMRKICNVIDALDDALYEKISMLMGELTHYSTPATFED